MAITRRFVVMKDANTDTITYSEYEKLKGYNVKPKENLQIEDMINVNEMIIINPSLIKKLVNKKCTRTIDRIIAMLSVIDDSDDSDETPIHLVLDEIEKLKVVAHQRYQEYMEKEEYKLLTKKIEILETEATLRLKIKRQNGYDKVETTKGKKGR